MEDNIETVKRFFAQFGFEVEYDEEYDDSGGRWHIYSAPTADELPKIASIINRVPVVVDPKGNVWVQQPFNEM